MIARMPLAVLLMSALTLVACNQTTNVENQRELVIVTGTGEVLATPDIFRVRAVAVSRGDQVATLRAEVDRQVEAVLQLTRQLGIDEKRVSARELQVTPDWQYQPERRLLGYEAERPVDIQVPGMAVFAQLMSGLTKAGITRIQPRGADFSNLEQLEQRALEEAVADARARAQVLARAAGRELGPAVHIAEQGGDGPVMMHAMAERAGGPGEYQAGEQSVRQRVEVRFALR